MINASIEFVAYRPLRGAPRLAPLITAIGMSFILQNVAIAWKGPGLHRDPERASARATCSRSHGVVYTWEKLIVVLVTVPVLLGLMWLVQQDAAGQGDARDGAGSRRRRDDGHQRQPDDLVHVPDRRRASPGAAGLLYALYFGQVRYDTGFQLGLIAFTAAVLGGIGNLPGAVLGALSIGFIQAYNEGLTWHTPGSDWTQSIVFSILILILVFRPEGLLGERTPEGA